ncbi:MAG: hypothetical protein Q4G33_06745, partial [bacterium]|nr:hypothetical protein [bacterium]
MNTIFWKYKNKIKKILAVVVVCTLVFSFMGNATALMQYTEENISLIYNKDKPIDAYFDSSNNTLCSTSHDGISVNVLKTIADRRSLYVIFTVNAEKESFFSDECFFKNILLYFKDNNEQYGSHILNTTLLEEDSHTKKYMTCIAGTSKDISSGNLILV